MNYDYTEKEFSFFIRIYQMLKSFAAEHPMDTAGPAARENIRAALAKMGETPYLTLGIGSTDGLGSTSLMTAMESVAAVSPSLYLTAEYSTRVFGRALARWGNAGQKEKWLAPLTAGRLIAAVALCEETASIENKQLTTTGEKQGDNVIVHGRKQFVVNAPVADVIGVAGMFEGKPALFLVEKGTPGLTIENAAEPIGYAGASISGIRLDGCVIPAANVIIAGGSDLIGSLRFWENQILLGASLGLMKSAFETARDYAKTHKNGGKPVIAFQEVGFKLSEMLTLFQTAQLIAARSVWTAENDPREADTLTLCAKVFCTEAAEQVTSEALRILGSSGCLGNNPVERAFCCAKYGQVFGTSTELSRVKIGDAALR